MNTSNSRADSTSTGFCSAEVPAEAKKAFGVDLIADHVEPGNTYRSRVMLDGMPVDIPDTLRFHTQALWKFRSEPPDFTLATPGASTLVDSTGKTWTVNAAASFRDVEVRGIGELAKWPTRWTITEALKTAPVQASGLTRRLSRPSAKLRSPLYREAIAADNLPRMDAYWPGEDGTEATQLASGLPGGSPMTIIGSPSLAASTRIPGSDPLLSLTTGSTLTGAVPLETATGQIAFRMVVDVPDASWGADVALIELQCNGGAVRRWRMFVTPAGDMYLRGYNSSGTLIASGAHEAVGLNGLRGMLGFQFTQSGSDVLWQVFARRIQDDLTVVEGGFAATFTALGLLGRPERSVPGSPGRASCGPRSSDGSKATARTRTSTRGACPTGRIRLARRVRRASRCVWRCDRAI
jgi:hypothetical protein